MAEPIAALIVRILADTSEMVTGVKNVTGQLDSFENRVAQFGKALAGYFSAQAVIGFGKQIIAEIDQIDSASKRIGASSEEFQRFSYAVTQSSGDAAGALAGIVSLTDRLAQGDAGLLGVLKRLNISFDEFNARDPIARYRDLALAIAAVESPTERLELRLEAMGAKGEKALAAIDSGFDELMTNAPVYTDEMIKQIDRADKAFDRVLQNMKVNLVNSLAEMRDIFTGKSIRDSFDFAGDVRRGNPGDRPPIGKDPKSSSGTLDKRWVVDGPLGPAMDPNDANQLAVALAHLELEMVKVKNAQDAEAASADKLRKASEQLSAEFYLNRAAVAALAAEFEKEFPKDSFIEGLDRAAADAKTRISELIEEEKKLRDIITPGWNTVAGDDVDAEIFKLRQNKNNWINGNLTPEALEVEHRLINNFNMRSLANMLRPAATPTMPSAGAMFPGMATPGGPTHITINAQGSWWDSPDRMNQMTRMIEDSIARRSGLTNTYSRR